jgi:hypothetical protein
LGASALKGNLTGFFNTASGFGALAANATGDENVAAGGNSLVFNTSGSRNTAIGVFTLRDNTAGADNIALGHRAGLNLTTGDFNIVIGSLGVAADANTIRIGTPDTHVLTFIAGIRGVTTGAGDAIPVVIDSNGQLGTASSSRRFKDDIADMDTSSRALLKLRPVTFHYKSDQRPSGRTLQYGLIAEEVAEVYPGLVAHSADGQIETVMYQFLPPMLLNEYQKQQRTIQGQASEIETQAARLIVLERDQQTLAAELVSLNAQVADLLRSLARRPGSGVPSPVAGTDKH